MEKLVAHVMKEQILPSAALVKVEKVIIIFFNEIRFFVYLLL